MSSPAAAPYYQFNVSSGEIALGDPDGGWVTVIPVVPGLWTARVENGWLVAEKSNVRFMGMFGPCTESGEQIETKSGLVGLFDKWEWQNRTGAVDSQGIPYKIVVAAEGATDKEEPQILPAFWTSNNQRRDPSVEVPKLAHRIRIGLRGQSFG